MRSVFYSTKGTIIMDNTNPYLVVYKEGIGNGESMFTGVPKGIICTSPVQPNYNF